MLLMRVKKKVNALQLLVTEMSSCMCDVAAVTETWLSKTVDSNFIKFEVWLGLYRDLGVYKGKLPDCISQGQTEIDRSVLNTQLCVINVIKFLIVVPFMCYHVKFGSSATKGIYIK